MTCQTLAQLNVNECTQNDLLTQILATELNLILYPNWLKINVLPQVHIKIVLMSLFPYALF